MGIDLALFDQDERGGHYRRGESRLKVFRVGEPLSLSAMLPMLTSMGVEVVDERPYELDRARPALLHLRVRPAPRPDARSARAHPVRRGAARGVGRLQRDRRLQPARPRRRADLAAGHRAARVRQVPQAGQLALRPRLHRGGAAQQRRHHPAAGRALRVALRPRSRRPLAGARRRGAGGQGGGDRGAARQGPRRRRQPRPRPHPALLPHAGPGDAAHQLLPALSRRRGRTPTSPSSSSRRPSPTCPSRARASRSSSTAPASRAPTCASARWRAAACAGRTVATTSAPRCSDWSRRRW